MSAIGVILSFEPLNPVETDKIQFSYPMDNGIRIISPELLTQVLQPPYYGDIIDLKFWKLLGIPFGGTPTPSTPLTRIDGYRYVYNHSKKTFDAYDDNGIKFVHIDNIQSIADMNIDFTIHKSHQFEIIVEDIIYPSRFIFPAKLRKDNIYGIEQKEIEESVQNIYVPDRVRPYDKYDVDNPSWDIKHLAGISDRFAELKFIPTYVLNPWKVMWLNRCNTIDWSKNYPTNYFYLARYETFNGQKLLQLLRAKIPPLNILLPMLAFGLYPNLMPIERDGETQNNRPVYEPWLIMMIKFLFPYITEDPEDDFVIPIFDLSPDWD